MTTESSKHGATTSSRMNFSGYVGHVTVGLLIRMPAIASCF